MRRARLSLALVCLAGLAGALPASAAAPAGEPFFPRAGNRGYDALDYRVRLAYKPRGARIEARTAIDALATEPLRRFSLDFFGPAVSEVEVDREPARFRRRAGKLVVSPRERIARGKRFTVAVRYGGLPPTITDPDGTQEGWYRTDDGAIALGEPQGTAAWIPCNNVPADKASFEFGIVVPDGLKAIANGRRLRNVKRGDRVQMNWVERAPMSPYLAVLNIGRGRIVKGRIGRLPTWTLIDPRMERISRRRLAALGKVLRFQAGVFGPYPFDSAGSIVDFAPGLGYALESQSRPFYAFDTDLTTLVHETAHQWFGNSVGIERWPQIWLNEAFATWAQWYYAERHGRRSAHAIFKRLHAVPASNEEFWNPPPGRPGSPRNLFDPSVYVRGAMTVQALRQRIGTRPMLRLLRRWTSEHRHGSATTAEFIALAERISDSDLDNFFQRWLYARGKP